MDVWYEKYMSDAFRKEMKAYFDRRFAWRFDDPRFAFDEVMDRLTRSTLPSVRNNHPDNPRAYVYRCFKNLVLDQGDRLYTHVSVPEPLASYGNRFKRLFWDFCLHGHTIRELAGYCELSEPEVRTWVAWLTRERKCPKAGVHGAPQRAGQAAESRAMATETAVHSPFAGPDEDFRVAQWQYFLHLWCEESPPGCNQSLSALERRWQSLPRPHLSTTEKLVLRCQRRGLSVQETAEWLGMCGKEQQIRNARSSLKKRLIRFCQDNGIEF